MARSSRIRRGAGGGKKPPVMRFDRITTLDLSSEIASWAGIFTFNLSTDEQTLFVAADADVIALVDISDINNPAVLDSADDYPVGWGGHGQCREIVQIDSTTVAAVHRRTTGNVSMVQTWDTTGGTLTLLDTWDTAVEDATSTSRFSGCVYDAPYLYVAGRIDATPTTGYAYSFDLTDPSDIQLVKKDQSAGWEDHGCAISGDYVFWPNYGNNGDINIRVTQVTNGSWSSTVDTPNYFSTITAAKQRAYRPVIDGNYLYCSNIESGNAEDRTEGGLLIYDITNPSSPLADPVHVPLHRRYGTSNAADPSTPQGDDPNFSIAKHGNYVYLSNGNLGVAVVNVANPANPVFMGTFGDNLPANENIKAVQALTVNGQTYCLYGSGPSSEATAYRTLYIDKVLIL